MTVRYFPASAGPGAAVLDTDWSAMARLFAESGVIRTGRQADDGNTGLNQLAVSKYGAGMAVQIQTGKCLLKGVMLEIVDDVEILTVPAADPGTDRTDLVIAYYRWVAPNAFTGGFAILGGSVATTGPSLSAVDGIEWRLPLGLVTIPAATVEVLTPVDAREWCVLGAGPLCKIQRTTAFSIPSTDPTLVQFTDADADLSDTENMHSLVANSGTRIVCTIPGWYQIDAAAGWSAFTAGHQATETVAEVLVNGAVAARDRRVAAASSDAINANHIGGLYPLGRGDYVELRAFQNSDQAQTLEGGTTLSVAYDRSRA